MHPVRRTLFLVALAAAACTGTQEALQTTDLLAESSKKAASTIDALIQADAVQVAAHTAARRTVREALHEHWQGVRREAELRIHAAHADAVLALDRAHREALAILWTHRAEAGKRLGTGIEAAMADLVKAEALAERAALDAQTESDQAPSDRVLYTARLERQREYLAIAARSRELELEARAAGERRLDAVLEQAGGDLDAAAAKQRGVLDQKREQALAKLPSAPGAIELGPDPTTSESALAGLRRYAEATEAGAKALRNYISAGSFGRGSVFGDFVRSLTGGLLGGAVGKAQGATGWKDLKGSLHELATSLWTEARTQLTEAGQSAAGELIRRAIATDRQFADGAGGAVRDAVRTGSPKPDERK